MNKKQRTLSTFLCFSYVTCFLDSLNNCREVSKTFIPRHCTMSLKMLEPFLSSRNIQNILLKKNRNILYLDLSRCYYLNNRTLAEILANFKCLLSQISKASMCLWQTCGEFMIPKTRCYRTMSFEL